MKLLTRAIILTVTAAAAALMPLICSSASNPDDAAAAKNRLVLTLGVNDIYCLDSSCSCISQIAARTYGDLQQRLQDSYGIELKLVYFQEPYELEKAVRDGKFDGIICKPWFAAYSAGSNRTFSRISDVLDIHNNQWLTGVVIVNAGSPFKTLGELAGRRVVIGQPDAYEKHYAALKIFNQAGVKPGKIYQKASCMECLGEVMDGRADAAVISDYALTADCAVDFTKPENFRILGASEKIPLTSVMLDMKKVSSADAARLKQALLAVSGDKMPKSFLSKGFVEASGWTPAELKQQEK